MLSGTGLGFAFSIILLDLLLLPAATPTAPLAVVAHPSQDGSTSVPSMNGCFDDLLLL